MAIQARKRSANGKPAAQSTKADFTIVVAVGEDIGQFKAGDNLTEARHIDEFFLAHAGAVHGDETVERLSKVTREQRLAVIKGTEGDNEKKLAALVEAPFRDADTSDIPTRKTLEMSRTSAVGLGAAVDAETEKAVEVAFDGKKESDASPIVLRSHLRRQDKAGMFSTPMNQWPPVGSRYQPSKQKAKDKAPAGYRLPNDRTNEHLPIWNGDYDYYETDNHSGKGPSKIYGHFLSEFVGGTKTGKYWATRVDQLKDALKNVKPESGFDPDIEKNRRGPDGETNEEWLNAELAESAEQFNFRKLKYTRAIELDQAIRTIEDRFSLSVILTGDYLKMHNDKSLRLKAPFMLVKEVPSETDPNKMKDVKSQPQTLTFILSLARKAHSIPANASIAKLTEKKRGRQEGDKDKEPGARQAKVKDVHIFGEYLDEIDGYLSEGANHALIRQRLNDAEDGGAWCSRIVVVVNTLRQFADNPDVQRRAKAHDDAVNKAMADKAEAKAA